MINIDKPSEGIDYIVEGIKEVNNPQAWKVKILRGKYKGAVVIYNNITFNGPENILKYKMTLIESPDPDLVASFPPFEDYTGRILEDLIDTHLANGTLIYD